MTWITTLLILLEISQKINLITPSKIDNDDLGNTINTIRKISKK